MKEWMWRSKGELETNAGAWYLFRREHMWAEILALFLAKTSEDVPENVPHKSL